MGLAGLGILEGAGIEGWRPRGLREWGLVSLMALGAWKAYGLVTWAAWRAGFFYEMG